MRLLSRRAADRKWNQPKGERCDGISKTRRVKSFRPFDFGLGATGFGIGPVGFLACFDTVFPHYVTIPPFWIGNVYSVPMYVGSI